jgi:cytochrome c oxidase subunit 2
MCSVLSSLGLITFCDAPEAWQLSIQDPATPFLEGMLVFHDLLVVVMIVVGVFVSFILVYIFETYNASNNKVILQFSHLSVLEIIWTLIPAIILIIIAVPSFSLLYSLDELIDPSLTLKIIGHQWYWSYEYSDFTTTGSGESLNFDSYMLAEGDLTFGSFRLLEVDNRVVLPTSVHIRLLVTAADVLHSWTIPSFGVKIDACPGRLSQASLFLKRDGVFYGQCSEICGINHGFMPIVVRSIPSSNFINWVALKLELL